MVDDAGPPAASPHPLPPPVVAMSPVAPMSPFGEETPDPLGLGPPGREETPDPLGLGPPGGEETPDPLGLGPPVPFILGSADAAVPAPGAADSMALI